MRRSWGSKYPNVQVPDGNGAAIRQEGRNLILSNVHFHDNEMGVLTGKGTRMLLIENSRFENNGYRGSDLGHNIYAQGETLKFRFFDVSSGFVTQYRPRGWAHAQHLLARPTSSRVILCARPTPCKDWPFDHRLRRLRS